MYKFLFLIVIGCGTLSCSIAQVIERRIFYIPNNGAPNAISELQTGTTLTFLNDSGICIGGQIIYVNVGSPQQSTSERQFIIKLDSLYDMQWTDTFMLFNDYYPDHDIQSITQLPDGGIVFDTDSGNGCYQTVVRKSSISGNRIWSKTLPSDSLNGELHVTKFIHHHDTLVFSGTACNSSGAYPEIVFANQNADTISNFYLSQIPNALSSNVCHDIYNNIYAITSNFSMFIVFKFSPFGVVTSIDTFSIAIPYDLFPIPITPNKFALLNPSQHNLSFVDSSGVILNTFQSNISLGNLFLKNNGSIILTASRMLNHNSILPVGNYILEVDSLGQLQWGILHDQNNYGDLLNAIKQYDDSTFFGTGCINDPNGDVLFMKFKTPYFSNRNLTYISDTLCLGDSLFIQAPPGLNYFWNTGSNSQQIYVNQAGDYFSVLFDQDGGFVMSDTIHVVQIQDTPIGITLGPDTSLCNQQSIVLNGGNSFDSYLWNNGETSQTINVTNTSLGNDSAIYSVVAIDSNGCLNTHSIQVNFTICSGESQPIIDNFSVYPNPVHDNLIICSADFTHGLNIEISDCLGKIIFSKNIQEEKTIINFKEYPSGIYIYKISGNSERISIGKFVKE